MSGYTSTAEEEQAPRFWLVGLRLDPNFSYPDFHTVLQDKPAYWPIMYEGQIIFFQKAEAAQEALDFYLRYLGLPPSGVPTEPALTLDFAQALYLLSSGFRDEASYVLNIINTLLDMFDAASITLPAKYRFVLHQAADHLTFSKEIESLFNDRALNRAEVIEAIQWGLGAVLTKAMFFPKPTIVPDGNNGDSGPDAS
jgi:hypothetical protein